jgi:hypothetical protein
LFSLNLRQKFKVVKILNFSFFLIIITFIQLSTSCNKPVFFSKKNLEFSEDTVVFDTVFTTIGSTTKQFKIYNRENRTLQIDEIELMGGENSPFRINVDGNSSTIVNNIELEGGDSLFVFVEVTLQVNNQNLPLVVEDSIRFKTNGKDQYVNLAAWGQDAYFHYKDLNEGTWPNDKPHVIFGYAAVDSAKTLNIQAGTNVYMHKNAILYVYKGTLNVDGAKGQEVTFQGDRLESDYDDVSGQFYGIYFQEARPSSINYAIIKNGISGVHLFSKDASFSDYTLTIKNSTISNCARYGVFIYSGARVKAENCIIAKNGNHALLVLEGGDFFFNHCNLLGYGNGDAATPAVGISNYYNDYLNGVQNIGSVNEGKIYNSVIYGNLSGEVAFDTIIDPGINLNFDFKNNLIKSDPINTASFFTNTIWNQDPQFTAVADNDFTFATNSPLNNAADPVLTNLLTPPVSDIEGDLRSLSTPDIGAIEN